MSRRVIDPELDMPGADQHQDGQLLRLATSSKAGTAEELLDECLTILSRLRDNDIANQVLCAGKSLRLVRRGRPASLLDVIRAVSFAWQAEGLSIEKARDDALRAMSQVYPMWSSEWSFQWPGWGIQIAAVANAIDYLRASQNPPVGGDDDLPF